MNVLRILAVTAALAAAAPAAAQPILVGVISPRTAMPPKDAVFALLLMPRLSEQDKTVCEHLVARYRPTAATTASAGGYRMHWPVQEPTSLTREDCAANPPALGVKDALYDYQLAPDLARQLRLKSGGGPYLVLVRCDPDRTSLVNSGYISLGASASDVSTGLDAFEDYLANPKRWDKGRPISRSDAQKVGTFLGTPARVLGRFTGLIKKMHACERA